MFGLLRLFDKSVSAFFAFAERLLQDRKLLTHIRLVQDCPIRLSLGKQL